MKQINNLVVLRKRLLTSFFSSLIIFGMLIIFVNEMCMGNESSDSLVSITMLTAPATPGFVLLGVEPTSVDRPGTGTDLALVILNRTSDLNNFPKDLSLDFMPYWIFFGEQASYNDYLKDNPGTNFLQTASISVATTNRELDSITTMTSAAMGLRFSILRGEVDSVFLEKMKQADSAAKKLNTQFADGFWDDSIKNDMLIIQLDKQADEISENIKRYKELLRLEGADSVRINTWIDHYVRELDILSEMGGKRGEELKERFESNFRTKHGLELDQLKELISELPFRRIGWKLDMAGGVVLDFINNDFDKGDFNRWGIWFTGGYEWRNWSALGVFRYLGNDNDSDMATLDVGGRVILDNFKKFSLSAEAVNRSFPNMKDKASEYRAALQFDYAIARNKSVSFTFGRDFEGKQSGNLISIINIIMGFGSDRPVIK